VVVEVERNAFQGIQRVIFLDDELATGGGSAVTAISCWWKFRKTHYHKL